MLAKLALRNVRRSARDYAIYFVTLLFGVAVFYAFNSIGSQSVLLDIETYGAGRMLAMTNYFLGLFSVAVALVLAFLVAYANRFIIKRRKREFGTYLLLGMSASKVAVVLFVEMLAVGMVSLAVGLTVGLLLSQGLAFATAALMGTTMTQYHFVVSTDALGRTLVCFAVLFAATLVMNVAYVSRRKLGDLLTTRSDNARGVKVPLLLRALGFVLALTLLAASYWLLWDNKFSEIDGEFLLCTCLMVVGTVLLFWSGSTMVLAFVRCIRGFYYQGLRAFTSRQVSSKIGTAFSSLSIVCIMLFFALSTVSIAFGVRAIFVGNVEQTTQYDATFADRFCNPVYPFLRGETADTYQNRRVQMEEESSQKLAAAEASGLDMASSIAMQCPSWNDFVRASAQIDYYEEPGMEWGTVLDVAGVDDSSMSSLELFGGSDVMVVSVSQFNAVCALTGRQPYQLADDQYLVNNTIQQSETVAGLMRAQAAPLSIAGFELTAAPDAVAVEMRTGAISDVPLELVVPDKVIDAMRAEGALPTFCYLNVMYDCDRVEGDEQLAQALKEAYPSGVSVADEYSIPADDWPYNSVYTANEMVVQAGGLKLLITYLALYIGFVLLVSTAAILAVQQLSETADSVGRYQRLWSLGCDKSMILSSLLAQSLLYFLVPLVVALVHSAYAVYVMNVGLFAVFGIDPMSGIVITGGLVLVVYGCYLLVTYFASRNVVCEACGF